MGGSVGLMDRQLDRSLWGGEKHTFNTTNRFFIVHPKGQNLCLGLLVWLHGILLNYRR